MQGALVARSCYPLVVGGVRFEYIHGLAAGLAVDIREYWLGVHGHVRLSDSGS